MTPREYQEQAIQWLSKTRRGLVQVPAGGGKTFIAAAAVERVLINRIRTRRPVIKVMVNTREQCDQFEEAFDRFPTIFTAADVEIGCAAGNLDPAGCDLLIVDECHHSPAESWAKKVEAAKNARWGLSATPWSPEAERNEKLRQLFSSEIFVVGREQLVEDGHLTPAVVRYLSGTDSDAADKIDESTRQLVAEREKKSSWLFRGKGRDEQVRRARWQASVEHGIVGNEARNQAIINTAFLECEAGASVLILVGSIEHGKYLASQINAATGLCYSGLGKAKRRKMIAAFRAGELSCMIATSLADEGFDAPRANVLIMAQAGRSKTKLEQRTGRVLRPFPGKDAGLIYDFADTFTPMLRAQAWARLKMYRKLKYTVEDCPLVNTRTR